MSVRLPLSLLAAAALVSIAPLPAAHAGPPCVGGVCDGQDRCGHPVGCECSSHYTCRVQVDSEPVEKECALIETDVICVPPITTSPFDCLRDLLSGKSRSRCGGCGANGCDVAGCDGGARCGRSGGGWLSKLANSGCGGIRCVNTLDMHEYECGRRCTYEWSAVPAGGCGPQSPARIDAGPRQVLPPPAPAPSVEGSADSDDAERGAAKQAIDR